LVDLAEKFGQELATLAAIYNNPETKVAGSTA
jgi:hypothetical protein